MGLSPHCMGLTIQASISKNSGGMEQNTVYNEVVKSESESKKIISLIIITLLYGRLSLTLVRANACAFNARLATTMDLLEG